MINKLKNTPVRVLIKALEQDGFQYKRRICIQRVGERLLLFLFKTES